MNNREMWTKGLKNMGEVENLTGYEHCNHSS